MMTDYEQEKMLSADTWGMFGRDTATVEPGSTMFLKEEDIRRIPSLNFSLEVASPEIPSTTAVCSGFLHSLVVN